MDNVVEILQNPSLLPTNVCLELHKQSSSNSARLHDTSAGAAHEMPGIEHRITSNHPLPTPSVSVTKMELEALLQLRMSWEMFQCVVDYAFPKPEEAKAYFSICKRNLNNNSISLMLIVLVFVNVN